METKDKGQVVHYYNREKRLERASDTARFAAERQGAKRPGLLRSLTATRSLRFLFYAVLLMSLASVIVGFVERERDTGALAGCYLKAEAMWFEGQVYVSVARVSPWYARLGFGAKAPAPVAIGIAVGSGPGSAIGVLQAQDADIRLRFPSEDRPPLALVVATIGDGTIADQRLELLARVR